MLHPYPPAHPFLLKTMVGQLLWGIPPKYTFHACAQKQSHVENCLHTRPFLKTEDLEAVVGCPELRARTLAEAKQGLAGACCRGWGRGE